MVFDVGGRLWQDSENRVYLIKELDRITGQVAFQIFVLFMDLWFFSLSWNFTYHAGFISSGELMITVRKKKNQYAVL